jgi:hypothetical protein
MNHSTKPAGNNKGSNRNKRDICGSVFLIFQPSELHRNFLRAHLFGLSDSELGRRVVKGQLAPLPSGQLHYRFVDHQVLTFKPCAHAENFRL